MVAGGQERIELREGASEPSFGPNTQNSADEAKRTIVEYLETRAAASLRRQRERRQEILRKTHLLVISNDPETTRRANCPSLLGGKAQLNEVRVGGLGELYFPKYREIKYERLDESFDLLFPRGKARQWQRLGHIDWKTYSACRRVSCLKYQKARDIQAAIRLCGHITGPKEQTQMQRVLEQTSSMMTEALARKGMPPSESERIVRATAEFLVQTGLHRARLAVKKKIVAKIVEATKDLSSEGKNTILGVTMRLFSAGLEAQKRLELFLSATFKKYGANAQILRLVEAKTNWTLSDLAENKIPILLSIFPLLASEVVVFPPDVTKTTQQKMITAQKEAIVANLVGWSVWLQREVKVSPYLAPATIVAIRMASPKVSSKDRARWGYILGEGDAVKGRQMVEKILKEENFISLLSRGEYTRVRELLADCQNILRGVTSQPQRVWIIKT